MLDHRTAADALFIRDSGQPDDEVDPQVVSYGFVRRCCHKQTVAQLRAERNCWNVEFRGIS